ncbi:hypothetical protein EON63_23940 [archaeon]|nr:MAG: hypothetical protein EON63_23940 [archaeon]
MSADKFRDRLFYSHLRLHLPGGAVAKDGPSAGAGTTYSIFKFTDILKHYSYKYPHAHPYK